jgi:NitT/TauT family transport system substrate-binding protein
LEIPFGPQADIVKLKSELWKRGKVLLDPQARLDAADVERQVEWYKSQSLIDSSVVARNVMDLSFIK